MGLFGRRTGSGNHAPAGVWRPCAPRHPGGGTSDDLCGDIRATREKDGSSLALGACRLLPGSNGDGGCDDNGHVFGHTRKRPNPFFYSAVRQRSILEVSILEVAREPDPIGPDPATVWCRRADPAQVGRWSDSTSHVSGLVVPLSGNPLGRRRIVGTHYCWQMQKASNQPMQRTRDRIASSG